jgi:hypothetical protein
MSELIQLTNLRIPSKGINYFYANYTYGTEEKESIFQSNPVKKREVNVNCPAGLDLFTHMKICLIGYFYEDNEEGKSLMQRVIKSSDNGIEFGNFTLWSEDGNYTVVVNNVGKTIYLKKI